MTAVSPDRGAEQRLASGVEQLRAERDGLREAMRTRAVIEQAKGILVGRYWISADDAFDRLRRMSQQTNVRLAQVAAGMVAQASPRSTARVPHAYGGGRREPVTERHRWLRVVGERLTDSTGWPTALRGCVQDLSQLRSAQPRQYHLSGASATNRRRTPRSI